MSAPRVAIVVLNFNGLEDTLRCLESLRAIPEPVLTILVDNASAVDPIPQSQAVYPDLVTVRTERNLGYAGGNNVGLATALERGAEYILVLNNDTTVDPAIISSLSAVLDREPQLGIVGPVVNFMDEPLAVMTDGVTFNPGPGTEFFKRIVVPLGGDPPTVVPVDIVNGCCMLLRSDMLRVVGMFDERLFIVHEESDLCLRARRRGYRAAVLGRTLVWHKGSSAFQRTGRQLQRYFDARNLWYLLWRHTGHVGRSRPFWRSVWHYALYTFYRYDLESEAGQRQSATAVAVGVADALAGARGPYRAGDRDLRRRLALWAFGLTRTLKRSVR